VIFGAVIDNDYEGEIHVTIIATGFEPTYEEGLLTGKVVVSPPPLNAPRRSAEILQPGWQVWS
jgi:cell division GTPase FtsZ